MKLKLAVFDVDGTIFSSDAIVEPAYAAAVATLNREKDLLLKAPSRKEILDQIGRPAPVILQNLFPNLEEEHRTRLGKEARAHLIRMIREGRALLYPGVRETLSVLSARGLMLRAASNGNPDYLDAIFTHYGLYAFFGELTSIYDEGLKDKGDILNFFRLKYYLAPDEMIMVGDRVNDLEAAKKAGCPFIGVSYGHGGHSELKDVPLLAHRFEAIPELIGSRN